MGILASKTISFKIIDLLAKLPAASKIAPKLREMYLSMRTCVAPVSLFWTVLISIAAWLAECIAYYFLWMGIGVKAAMGACIFIYAVATLFGIPAPGGVGPTDFALYALPETLEIVDANDPDTGVQITLVTILTRFATMWFGVAMGALALIRVSNMLGGKISLKEGDKSA